MLKHHLLLLELSEDFRVQISQFFWTVVVKVEFAAFFITVCCFVLNFDVVSLGHLDIELAFFFLVESVVLIVQVCFYHLLL